MTRRPAFTLVELIIAIMIFSYMAASLVTIYSTSHRHMAQNYRSDHIKTNTIVAMRAVQNNLIVANRVDFPLPGQRGNRLSFTVNVDKHSGCYPLNQAVPSSWHHFCLGADPLTPGFFAFYYHTGTIAGGGAPCGNPAAAVWTGVYPVPICGTNAPGQQVYKLMQYISPDTWGTFSRSPAQGINDDNSVRVFLRTRWPAQAAGLAGAQRDMQFTLDTVVSANSAR